MREKIRKNGIKELEPHEVLEYLLFSFVPRRNTNDIAHRLIQKFGSLSAVFDADYNALVEVDGMTANAALFITQMPAFFVKYKMSKAEKQRNFLDADYAAVYLNELIGHQPVECIAALAVDVKGTLLGTIQYQSSRADAINLDMRNLVKELLLLRAAGVIIAHNHPSGSVMPSDDDYATYEYIKAALTPLDITLIDCMVVGNGNAFSLMRSAQKAAAYRKEIDAGDPEDMEYNLLFNRNYNPKK